MRRTRCIFNSERGGKRRERLFVLHTRRILHRKMNRCDCGIPESREERHFDEVTNIVVCINIHNIGESVLGSVTNYKRRFKKDVISRSKDV